ncbi:MAG: glycosyltransferase family 1 protein [Prevotellaceae bacterium]|nr:glycosyltransferase family 1 protein [Candidatus Faecinaster equi]
MKILLLGEYSNVHWTLAEGLRILGHNVTVMSNGDGWKNYHRDISVVRKNNGLLSTFLYLTRLITLLPKLKNYDIVQIINPVFFDVKAERIKPIYDYIRKHNKKVFLGAFGIDKYWVQVATDCKTFRYSDFNIGNTPRESYEKKVWIKDWIEGAKGKLNDYIANDCDGIICGLYEYYRCYCNSNFSNKITFIPFPINTSKIRPTIHKVTDKIRFFIGIQKERNAYKGTDIMLRALERISQQYGDKVEIIKAESLPYEEYKQALNNSHVLLDQLYSYTPAMNALLAMAKGIVVIGGGEEENYQILNEDKLRPIVNVLPNEDNVFEKLKNLVENSDLIEILSHQSIQYIEKYHDYKKVAQQYINLWSN